MHCGVDTCKIALVVMWTLSMFCHYSSLKEHKRIGNTWDQSHILKNVISCKSLEIIQCYEEDMDEFELDVESPKRHVLTGFVLWDSIK